MRHQRANTPRRFPITSCGGNPMQRLIQLEQLERKTRSYDAVCELLRKHSEVLLPGTQFYLAQVREVLRNEIAELEREHEDAERLAA